MTGASVGGIMVMPALIMLIERIGLSFPLSCGVIAMALVLVPITRWIRSPSDRFPRSNDFASPADTAGYS